MRKIINTISEGTTIIGRIYSPYPTQINGYVDGEIISKESVKIAGYGEVRGNIKTENAVIEGKLIGNIIVSENLEITPTGWLTGNIISKNNDVNIEQGGVLKGRIISVENEEIFEIKQDELLCNLEIKVKNNL